MHEITDEELDELLDACPEPEAGERTCAVCLQPIDRDKYEQHMQMAHGYETLNITSDDINPLTFTQEGIRLCLK